LDIKLLFHDISHGELSLAQMVVAKRDEIRARLLDATAPRDEQTLVLHALTDALIDRFAEAAAEGNDWAPLLHWADAMCKRHPRGSVRRMFQAFTAAVTETLGPDGLRDLTISLAEIAQRTLRTGTGSNEAAASTDIVDDVDVLCSEMLQRIEFHDRSTAEDGRAVSAWCVRIARRMSLGRRETILVARGGLIHDIGKVTVPPQLLQAPRPLSAVETDIVRSHAAVGYEMVACYPKLADLAPIVRSHHERFDGQGYPDGLERTRIPILARIVAVADAFNEMIGRRPYRASLSPICATAQLQKSAGTQLDPDVVRALLDVLSENPL
jgi:HD-GYP domain-containing protein (c-di-GMP phosphodiesterase class II)